MIDDTHGTSLGCSFTCKQIYYTYTMMLKPC
jgi:hypothetical protein